MLECLQPSFQLLLLSDLALELYEACPRVEYLIDHCGLRPPHITREDVRGQPPELGFEVGDLRVPPTPAALAALRFLSSALSGSCW
jgi:hypothetical protein